MRRALPALVVMVAVGAWALWSDAEPDAGAGGEARRTTATVVRVVDGDTLLVRARGAEERVRVLGIDTPEVAHQGDPDGGECYGAEATDAMRALVRDGTEVVLVSDPTQDDRDVYDRLLRYVVRRDGGDSVDVGRELVRSGAAEVYDSRTPTARQQAYERLQRAAESDGRGRWGAC